MEIDIRNRDENKEVALGTSKINCNLPLILLYNSLLFIVRPTASLSKVFPFFFFF